MSWYKLTPKSALALFIAISIILIAQAVWWISFMAILTDEKVEMAATLGADEEFLAELNQQEKRRQIMLGSEGVFFLILVGAGAWLIYRALVKTEELNFHQKNFLMAVTHELKTPLASMKIYVDSLQSPKISDERKATIAPKMGADLSRLERLVENILDAGRFERHGYKLNKTPLDFSQLISRSLDKLQLHPSTKLIKVERSLAPNIMLVGDPAALSRAIDAVLENSLKYTDADVINISADLTLNKNLIRLVLADNGIGLKPKDLTQVFNRFYRAGEEMTRTQPGSGLGLFLCREIFKAHAGTIRAESDGPGEGTTFIIEVKANGTTENDITG